MPFEKWLAQEKYDEADRRVRQELAAANDSAEQEDADVRRKRDGVDASKVAEAARAISRAAIQISAPCNVPLMVHGAITEKRGGDTWLNLETNKGSVAILIEGSSPFLQEAGQAHLMRLADACGLSDVSDSGEFHGRTFMIARGTFAAAPEQKAA
jgi:hypothetical protein